MKHDIFQKGVYYYDKPSPQPHQEINNCSPMSWHFTSDSRYLTTEFSINRRFLAFCFRLLALYRRILRHFTANSRAPLYRRNLEL